MKRIVSVVLTLFLAVSLFSGCSAASAKKDSAAPVKSGGVTVSVKTGGNPTAVPVSQNPSDQNLSGSDFSDQERKTPKYVFLFIGDAMLVL